MLVHGVQAFDTTTHFWDCVDEGTWADDKRLVRKPAAILSASFQNRIHILKPAWCESPGGISVQLCFGKHLCSLLELPLGLHGLLCDAMQSDAVNVCHCMGAIAGWDQQEGVILLRSCLM